MNDNLDNLFYEEKLEMRKKQYLFKTPRNQSKKKHIQ
jgi:hypothetical protein